MSNESYRVIIWGPGEIGGAAALAALERRDLEIVGAKVFSTHKAGRDVGELLGVAPIGVAATTSKDEILALDADVVIFTPNPFSMLEGSDGDVIDLLESGKNVVTTAGYHNVAMPNWASPMRASAARLAEACGSGGASLYGTGIHPTFMVEHYGLTMAQVFDEVEHIRFIEAVDFTQFDPEMWGGLGQLGFGQDVAILDDDFRTAMAGDLYYGDVIGNVAHVLYGSAMTDVRVERSFRGMPAAEERRWGSIHIPVGGAECLHITHRGYLADHHFFTNEEWWFLGADHAYHGEDLPFGGFDGAANYTVEITGEPATVKSQLQWPAVDPTVKPTPMTKVSVRSMLEAIPQVCAAEPGVLIADVGLHLRVDDRVSEAVPKELQS